MVWVPGRHEGVVTGVLSWCTLVVAVPPVCCGKTECAFKPAPARVPWVLGTIRFYVAVSRWCRYPSYRYSAVSSAWSPAGSLWAGGHWADEVAVWHDGSSFYWQGTCALCRSAPHLPSAAALVWSSQSWMCPWLSPAFTGGFAAVGDGMLLKLSVKPSLLCSSRPLSGGSSYLFAL